jgi:hypothetical protein
VNNLAKKLEALLNLSIITVALLLSIVLVKNYVFTNSVSNRSQTITGVQDGGEKKVSLPDVNWSKNGQTLLLFLSSVCHYCTESAPFYQQVVEQRRNTQLIALFPEAVGDSKRYLNNLGVYIDEVKQISFDSLEVKSTPTLMIVNSDGVMTDSWIGKLPADEEAKVLNRLNSYRASN